MQNKTNKYLNGFIIFFISAFLFIALTMPFRIRLSAADITEIRPTTALTPVLGMIFGLPAALGCAVGNMISDFASQYEMSYAIFSGIQQIIYGMLPYFLWKKINREHDGNEFRLDSISRILKFCLVMIIDAILIVICTGIMNHAYSVSEFISINNLYLLFNSFDTGLLFGCPLMIAGHLLQTYLSNLRNGEKNKKVSFSLNERMILNNIITGLGITFLIGAAVYLTDKMNVEGTGIGLWGRMYLFEMLALNFYFALSIGFMWFSEKRIAQPVEHLAEIAGNYYAEHSTDEHREKMIAACEKYADDSTEVGKLARSYISMVKELENYVSNLKSVTAEKERINAELTLASDIQAHMLPCIFPAFPEHDEFDLYASMTPAKEVGGDFYDFYMIDETNLAVVMADVSGKGVPAALFMVIAKTLIKNYAQMGIEPAEVFTTVNKMLCEGNDAGLFVTAWMGVLDLESGQLTYVNAGHNPPLLYKNNKDFEYLKSRPGFVLAGMETIKYKQNAITLSPGDKLFLYTDGVTEATNADKQLFGEDRLCQFMNTHRSDTAMEILHNLKKHIDKFVGEAPQFDDITMLMLDYKKKNGDNNMTKQNFLANENALSDVLGFVEKELEKFGCSTKAIMQLLVAIEEVFVNIAHYAYSKEEGEVEIGISFDSNNQTITFCITDKGIPFNPLLKPDPDITLSAEEREIGGLGIFICKKTMDDIHYVREDNKNILTMNKKIQ